MPKFENLYEELKRAKIPLQEYDPTDHLLAEADHTLKPHIHEGRIITYGFIRVEHLASIGKYVIVSPDALTLAQARSIADGKTLFIVIENKHYAGLIVLDKPLSCEREIVAFQKEVEGLICITDEKGITKFVSKDGISLHELRDWKLKPRVSQVTSVIAQYAPMVKRRELVAILEFCLHTLGANKIGATLVWFLDAPSQAVLTSEARVQTDTRCLEINLANSQNLSALQSILERNDGAALISPDGKVIGVGAHLFNSPKSAGLIGAYAGTRHTSARRFSFDRPETIVFTVSSDGPVSIFSDGLKIGELDVYDAFVIAQSYRRVSPDPSTVESNSWKTTCSNCGKISRIHMIFIYGWREHETVNCPVCGTEIAARKCYQLHAQLVKHF